MSAICGFINLTQNRPKDEEIRLMEEPYLKYRIDRIESLSGGECYFYCGHQHVTKEAEREVLPYEDGDIVFTADAMLDNREELIDLLMADKNSTDGQLIYLAYRKWGELSVNKLLGVFSYAIYDKKRKLFLLYTDHTGSRCIHYCITDKRIIFSTLVRPILQLLGKAQVGLNERWVSFCESIINPDMYFYTGDSPFADISHLEPGHYIRVEHGKCNKICYWNPFKNKNKLPKMTDTEYKRLYLDTFQECVESVLRSVGETGITLSSGLDSSAVACMAAPILAEENKKLYSYTSVPLSDYKVQRNTYLLADESEGPKKIAAMYGNVEPSFVSCEGESLFGQIAQMVDLLEVPCKSFANLLWMNRIYENAREKNCRIVIKGQYGNSTISYGAILSLVRQKLQTGHPFMALKELKNFMRYRGVGKRQVLHAIGAELSGRYVSKKSIMEKSFLKSELVKAYRIDFHLQKNIRVGGGSLMDSVRQHHSFVYSTDILQHLGLFDTKLGLIHGIVVRDPTKDKRMIELCMSLPPECFVHNGVERRMVREYMEGIVPEEIRKDVMHRGLQSADIVHRANKEWLVCREEICRYLGNDRLKKYLDADRLDRLVERLSCETELKNKEDVQTIIALASFSAFLKEFDRV